MTDIQAHVRFLPQSAQKVRAVIDVVRGKSANEALEILKFVNKRAAGPVWWHPLLRMLKRTLA